MEIAWACEVLVFMSCNHFINLWPLSNWLDNWKCRNHISVLSFFLSSLYHYWKALWNLSIKRYEFFKFWGRFVMPDSHWQLNIRKMCRSWLYLAEACPFQIFPRISDRPLTARPGIVVQTRALMPDTVRSTFWTSYVILMRRKMVIICTTCFSTNNYAFCVPVLYDFPCK